MNIADRARLFFAGALLVLPLTLPAAQEAPNAQPISPADPASLQRGIDSAAKAGLHKVVVPPGTYRLAATLHLVDLADLEIDARHVTLLRTTPSSTGIELRDCRHVTLRGITLEPEKVPFTQGTIEAMDAKSVDLRIHAGYPTDYFGHETTGYIFDPATRQWKAGSTDHGVHDPERLPNGCFRIPWPHPEHEAAVGDMMAFRGPLATDIMVAHCADIKLIDVTILSGSGFCVHESGGEGGNFYSYKVTYGPTPAGATDSPLIACNADAFHSSGIRKGPTLEHCSFEGMPDDGVAIHGTYAQVVETHGTDWVILGGGFCRAGDSIRLLDAHSALLGDATALAIAPLHDYHPPAVSQDKHFKDRRDFYRLTVDRPLPATFECRVSSPASNGSGYVVRDCTIRNHRARGMLLKADDGLIEGNTVDGSTIDDIVIAPEYWWNEACYSRNVIVRNNTLRHGGYATIHSGTEQAGTLTLTGDADYKGAAFGHQHIIIENNRFIDNDGVNLLIQQAQDVLVKNNQFIHAQERPTIRGIGRHIDPASLIFLSHCANVRLQGNTASDIGPAGKALLTVGPDTTGISGEKDGIQLMPAH